MLHKIHISHFRNFDDRVLSFSPSITIIVGDNAAGKTNILESVFLLSSGKSFKATKEADMVQIGQEIGRVKGKIKSQEELTLEVVIAMGRKKFLVNDVPRRQIDFAGQFPCVLFGPWDMDLVTGSPSLRRKFLDIVLSQTDREYRRSLHSYEKGLRQRNRLLYRMREEGISSRSQLLFWDSMLIKNGDYISGKREEFINFVNTAPSVNHLNYQLEYDKSAISEHRLAQYAREEVAAATTLVGPHRDEVIFYVNEEGKNRNLSSFGSRGEQRMGILWVKLSELSFIEKQIGHRPTLLLDDIFSELDHEHRDIVMQMSQSQQTIITTADPHFVVDSKNLEKVELYSDDSRKS